MSFDVFQELATDSNLEENGAVFPLGGGATVLVARSDNKAYGKALTKAMEKYKSQLDMEDDAADALSEQIMIDVIARTILLGWSNLSFKGEPLDYSVANAKKLLSVKEFRRRVMAFSNTFEAYKLKEEQAQGNG